MITTLTLESFRGFSSLEFPRLAAVNLIGGVNNAGKTAVLEAIYLLLQRDQNALTTLPSLFRAGSEVKDHRHFWTWLAHSRTPKMDSRVAATIDGPDLFYGSSFAINWSTKPVMPEKVALFGSGGRVLYADRLDGPGEAVWPRVRALIAGPNSPTKDALVYVKAAKKTGNEVRIENLLRKIDPRLVRLRAYPEEGSSEPILFADFGDGEALPATQAGQGFNHLMRIYASLLSQDANVFLIDEIETGLHHSVLPIIWKGLAAAARSEGVQIFATTHSREAILAAHRTFVDEPEYDFAYHRLERDAAGEIKAVTYDKNALEGADERNFEVR